MNLDIKEVEDNNTPFSSWFSFYNHLYAVIKVKDEAYLNNDLESWFKGINRIFNLISFKLSKEEKTLVIESLNRSREDIKLNMRLEATEKLHNIDLKLIELLDKYKMIFPKLQTQQTGREKLNKRYEDLNEDVEATS